MILSDRTIKAYVVYHRLIEPFAIEQLQPASYDLRLDQIYSYGHLYKELSLQPKGFVLCNTLETITLPADIVGRIEGKSSLARLGLIIHTAGFVDPGFRGELTLEVTNLGDSTLTLRQGMLIAQIAFQRLDYPSERPYGSPGLGSHYQNQKGPTKSAR